MKKLLKTLALTVAMTFAGSAMAQSVDLSATDYSKSMTTLNLAAGDYQVSLVSGLYAAWAPARTGVDAMGNNIPGSNWTDYYAYSINGGSTQYFNPLNSQRFGSAIDAFNAYSAGGPLTLSFAAPTTVTFAIADGPGSFFDNSGGVSLNVAAVPEPATWGLMILGFGMVGYAMRRAVRRSDERFGAKIKRIAEGAIA